MENLKNEADLRELETISSKLEENQLKMEHKAESLNNVKSEDEFINHAKNFSAEVKSSQNILDRAIELLSQNKTKFRDDWNSFIDSIKELSNEYYNFLETLTLYELGSLANLLAAFFTLLCVISLISIIYSNKIITYLNLENRFPKLAKIIQYRQKLQNYYLFMNFLFIVITLVAVIYVNFLALTI